MGERRIKCPSLEETFECEMPRNHHRWGRRTRVNDCGWAVTITARDRQEETRDYWMVDVVSAVLRENNYCWFVYLRQYLSEWDTERSGFGMRVLGK